MFLIAGSYERFVWRFSFSPKTLTTLTPLFSYLSHSAPIKALAAAGSVATYGASDESIKIYDLSSSSKVGSLLDHSGPVTALSFFTFHRLPLNLLSAGGDGTLNIYGADPFIHLKGVAVYRKGINNLAVHPSGRVALTVGRDERLGMVNLLRGKRSFVCKLVKEAEIVEYDDLVGDKFFMVSQERIGVHEAENARVVWELEGRKRVLCVAVSQKMCKRNLENRKKAKCKHTTGCISFAEKEYQLTQKNNNEKSTVDIIWESQHTTVTKEGVVKWADPYSHKKFEEIKELVEQSSQNGANSMSQEDILLQVFKPKSR